jgi:hypothetical protein
MRKSLAVVVVAVALAAGATPAVAATGQAARPSFVGGR